jgi:hypothetical protein
MGINCKPNAQPQAAAADAGWSMMIAIILGTIQFFPKLRKISQK